MVKEIESNLCFSNFDKNSKIQNGHHFWEEEIFFLIAKFAEIPCGSKISTKSLSRTVKEIEANLCFSIFGKNSKIQNGRHFCREENFLKIANSCLPR